MIKRAVRRVLAAAVLFCLTALGGCSGSGTFVTVHPPFFAVSDEETGGCVYMLGSMHAGERNTVYPDEVMIALRESDIVACEVDTVAFLEDEAAQLAAMSRLLCPEGMTARDFMGGSYEDIREYFRGRGIYSSVYDNYIPAVWSSALTNKISSECGLESDWGTEAVLLKEAKKAGKVIFEIESADEQYRITAEEPMALQIWSLEETISLDPSEQTDEMNDLYTAWKSGDMAALESLIEADGAPGELSEEYDEFYRAMYTDRQRHMAECVTEWLEGGERVFMLVGALHYCAEPDIITLLEEAGYKAEPIAYQSADGTAAA